MDRIRWRKKLLMEIIECYEDIQTTRNEIEVSYHPLSRSIASFRSVYADDGLSTQEAKELKKQQLYTLEISCRNDAFESRALRNRGKDKKA
ncbi:hypothetical protein K435DRAFT_52239 [Dendrothele bispora CBS 962.96]|uniref:Uncharacterized protein n=1 Tax=Dendrothele bispora (strain CBS 962.96) TaxID=1314807 RepID=A0A4S8M7J3_DENBC|nr:hypothetical protein K435DRAFT_52239 [Dendrothele bispora CBS 962.96]